MARKQRLGPKAPADGLTATQRYYLRHRERILAKQRQKFAENPALREAINARQRERRRTDPEYRKKLHERYLRFKASPKYRAYVKARQARLGAARAAARAEAERRGDIPLRWRAPDLPPDSKWPPERGRPPSHRDRAIVKLRFGSGPLTAVELHTVPSRNRRQARIVKRRTLREVGNIFGLTRERIRQILAPWIKR